MDIGSPLKFDSYLFTAWHAQQDGVGVGASGSVLFFLFAAASPSDAVLVLKTMVLAKAPGTGGQLLPWPALRRARQFLSSPDISYFAALITPI